MCETNFPLPKTGSSIEKTSNSIHYIFFLRRFKMKKDSLMSFCFLSKYLGTRLCSFLLTSHWACPLSTLIQEDLKLSLMVAAAWRELAELKGEGAAFVESKVCSLISQFGRKCSFMNVFMCTFYVNCKLLVRWCPFQLSLILDSIVKCK